MQRRQLERIVAAGMADEAPLVARVEALKHAPQLGRRECLQHQRERVERRDVERPRRPLRLAFGGVLSPWKGAHLLIQAVQQTTADVRLDIHGRTDEPMFQEYIDGLRDQAAGDDRVTFRGPYGLDEASDVFEEMDVLVGRGGS